MFEFVASVVADQIPVDSIFVRDIETPLGIRLPI